MRQLATSRARLTCSSLIAFFLATIGAASCGGDAAGPCPLAVPEDHALCNSGGVVVYCHYDCASGNGVDSYALCSGPRWTVTTYDVCAIDAGAE